MSSSAAWLWAASSSPPRSSYESRGHNNVDATQGPQTAQDVKGWVQTALEVIALLNTPAGIGLCVNLVLVQAIEAWDHILPAWMLRPGTKDVNKAMAVTLALVPSMFGVM